jgi:hypothetical protein
MMWKKCGGVSAHTSSNPPAVTYSASSERSHYGHIGWRFPSLVEVESGRATYAIRAGFVLLGLLVAELLAWIRLASVTRCAEGNISFG